MIALAGCPLLTVSPALLEEIQNSTDPVPRQVDANPSNNPTPLSPLDKSKFDEEMGADAMASEKLVDGIKKFEADTAKLEELIREKLSQ